MKLIIICSVIFIVVFAIAVLNVPKTPEEKRRENEEQIMYLKKWREEHNNKNKKEMEEDI